MVRLGVEMSVESIETANRQSIIDVARVYRPMSHNPSGIDKSGKGVGYELFCDRVVFEYSELFDNFFIVIFVICAENSRLLRRPRSARIE